MSVTDIFILGVLIAAVLFLKGRGVLAEYRVRAAAAKSGRGGDALVRELLLKKGYRIVGVHERLEFQASVNGKPHRGHIQADFVVRKDGKSLAVKVEPSGEQAACATRSEGRWHLLQMQILFGTAGVLIVDQENEKIYNVAFKVKKTTSQKEIFLLLFLSGAIVGAAAVLMIFSRGGFLP